MKKINLIEWLWKTDSHEKQKPQRFGRYAAMLIMLLTLGVGQMWADKNFWSQNAWNLKYYNGGSDTWIGDQDMGATYDLGVQTTLYFKGTWVKTWWDDNWGTNNVTMYYGFGSNTSSVSNDGADSQWDADGKKQCYWEFGADYNMISNAPNSVGQNTMWVNWSIDNWRTSSTCYINFTIPGFTNLSTTSVTFDNTTVDSNSSKSITYTHYGTAPTNVAARYSITGTDANQFSITALSGTGATIRFSPTSAGTKTATLVINDVHGKQTSAITLSGKTQYTVTYNKGDNGTGSNVTANKVYGTNLTLRNSGDFTRDYYHQTAWNTNSNGTSGTSYALGATYSTESPLTLYPTWAPNDYNVIYKDQGGGAYSGSNEASLPDSYTYGTGIAALTNGAKTGYMFDGWYSDSGCTGSVVTSISSSANGNKTLYAKWTAITVSATVDPTTGATGDTKNFTFSITSNVPTDGGYSVAVYNFGSVDAGTHGAGYLNSTVSYNASPKSYTASSVGGFSTAGVYTTNAVVIKGGTIQATSADIEYAAGDYYTVSFNMQGHGDAVSPQMIASGSKATEPDPAPSETGYTFGGWYKEAACTNVWNFSTETVSTNKTLFAKWTANQYTITFNKESGSGGTNSATVHFDNNDFSVSPVVCPTRTGYTFGGYYTSTGGAGEQIVNASGVWQSNKTNYLDASGNWINAANTNVYAKWTEVMSSLSTSCHYDAGNPSYAAPTVSGSATTVGYATTRTITATAAGTGYTFAGWTLTNCTRTDEGSATATSITIRSNGDGAAATVVANYTEVLTTDWKVIGDNQSGSPFGDNYAYASGKAMSKKTGHATEANAYRTIDVTKLPGSYYGFKVATAAGNSNAWGYGESDGYYITFNRSASGTQKQVYNGNQHELKFVPDALGEYEFRVNYPGNKYVYVTFPTAYTVTFGKGTGGNTVSASYSSTSFSSGTKVQSGKTVRFTQTASTGYQFKEWNTNSSGTGTQLSTNSSYYDHTVASSNTVYAIYDPKQYTITLNDQDATTAVSPSTVNATYKSLTLSSAITNPEKDGYTFGGWYSSVGGGGYLVINTSGALQASKEGYTDATGWTKTSAATLYAKWTQVLVLNKNGGATDGGLTVVYKKTATSGHTAATRTGYTLNGYYDAESGGNKIINSVGSLVSYSASVSSYIRTDGSWGYNGTPTLYAQWTAKSYDVTLKPNGATTGSDQVVRATYDATMPTQTKTSAALVAPTKTGYTLQGFYQNSNGTGTKYYNANMTSANNWDQDGNANIWAKWQANPYVVTLDVDETNQGNIEGATTSQNVSYDGATTTVPNRPTAANGYALMGYFTDQNGGGLQVIDGSGNWIASVTGYTDGSANWVHDGDVTLYAYYKKAEITNLELSSPAVAGGADISVTPTISPTPTGDTRICWEVQYNNGTALSSQPEMTTVGSTITFQAPSEAAIYRIECKLYTGISCGGGTLLDTRSTTFQVASEHEVTVVYKDTLGNTLKASTTVTAQPLDWSDEITAPAVPGYTFHHWILDEGLELNTGGGKTAGDKTTQGSNPIKIKATYAGTLTAVYYKKDVIYFNNTVGWDRVYVYFYSSNKYWDDTYGSGAQYDKPFKNGDDNNHKPHYRHFWGEMTQIEGTNVWYFDYQAAAATIDPSNASEINGYTNVAFTKDAQGYGYGSENKGYEWFHNTKAARRGDFKHSLPMYVPLTTKEYTKNGTDYYNHGYWMNYPENTGYTLKFYSTSGADKVSGASDSIVFPFSADKAMPLKLDVEFNTSGNRYFMIKRNDGNHYGKNYTIKQGYSDEQAITVVNYKLTVVPSAKGIYTFTLTYHDDNFYIDVDYPIASNDYRIYYTDNAAWSGAAHTSGWYHPSDLINKIDDEATAPKTDIVSMYIAKGVGITPSMKFQKASVTNEGEITWNDVASGTINLSSFSSDITAAGVYNIYVSQPVGGASITVDSIKPYTGNYYIRTDCAGSTKWDSYKALDHQMTYSDYTADNWGYTHYYCHWVTGGTNVKFTIANDYSVSVSDSLIADYGTVIANIDGSGFLASGSSNNANIRFMWNQATNKLSRAYIAGSGSITDRFLVLEGDAKMYDANGNALTGTHQDHDKWGNYLGTNNQVIMLDDENFVYERTIQVNTTARAKLTAKYNSNIQYFKGSEGAFAEGTTVELLGGSASGKHKMRIVYDFKTNRLVTAYLPSTTIEEPLAINADLMLVREHQNAGEQITFTGSGALSDVHTVYGVMRFNRWTLNNKSTADGHAPLGDPKSAYERGLYWISFPFDVNLSDVFGFGTYGVDWIIEYYDGAGRAQKGYWIDSPSFWKYVMPSERSTFTLKAGKGYVLALDLDLMKSDNEDFWTNNIEQVELFFPSATNVGGIETTTAHTTVDEHECKIDRTNNNGADINKNRTKADSHWNIIGIPSYANYGSTLTSDGETVVNWNSSPYTNDLPFLYEWNTVDNTYTVQSGTTYPFKSMHAYMVQYHGDLYWSLASATPSSPIVARRTYAEKPQSTEFRLELQQNDKKVDQTFVKLSNDENVSANFVFDEDLCKEYNANKANIYTIVENYLPVAGNTMPMSEQTTVVPVGVKIATTGNYTFAIPNGTSGVGVTLVDLEKDERTNLALFDYTINLNAGTYNERFVLEISPIQHTPTGVEDVQGDNVQGTTVRKVLIDNVLYIIRDGKVFDARGAIVK